MTKSLEQIASELKSVYKYDHYSGNFYLKLSWEPKGEGENQMTKSIEQQALDAAQFCKCRGSVCHGCGPIIKDSFILGAEARDEQWQAVVNELREALKFYGSDSPSWQRLEHTNSIISDVDLIKPKTVLYKGQLSGGRTADEALTKADQMLKEMGMK